MEGGQGAAPAPGPPDMDVVTQIQEHIALLCSRFFNFIGALQRDAPPAPLHIAANPNPREEDLQKQIVVMRKEIAESLTTLEALIQRLPDLEPEERQWAAAAELEAAGAAEAAALRHELEAAKAKLEGLYRAHAACAEAALQQPAAPPPPE